MQTDTEERQESDKETLGTRFDLEEVNTCTRRVKAAIPAEKVEEELEKSYKELTGMVKLPGFRQGRVPRRLLEARFASEIEKDVKESLVGTSFSEIIEERELKIVGEPRIENVELKSGADLEYEGEFEVRPENNLGKYKGIEVTREPPDLNHESVDEELQSLRRRASKVAPIELSEAGPEDQHHGHYSLQREGAEVKAGETTQFVPSSCTIDFFRVEDLVAKVEAWDRTSDTPLALDVKAPKFYPDEALRDVELQLVFTLEEVKRVELPELDDEFAKEVGEESLDGLRSQIRKNLLERAERTVEKKLEDSILEVVEAEADFELPETLIKSQMNRMTLEKEHELLGRGLSPEEVKEKLAVEGEDMEKELRRDLKRFFILTEIADKEKVFATEGDIQERLQLLAGLYGLPAPALREQLKSSGKLEQLQANLLQEKTRAFLRKKAKIKGDVVQAEKSSDADTSPNEKKSPDAGASEAK